MPSISLVSVNIERSKHLELVRSFFAAHPADVICMQELCERDVATLESALGMRCVYAPSGLHPADPPEEGGVLVGVGIFSRLPIAASTVDYYAGSETLAREERIHAVFTDHGLVICDIENDGATFRIMTTHFTWTPKGAVSDDQRRDLAAMLAMLESKGEFILCGDFNAPRVLGDVPGEIFAKIAERYKDNIPTYYETSLDPARHRAPLVEQADKMVDGLFSTPAYAVSDVILHNGVSDHCAITATVSRRQAD
jgi:endonuclease/exonuclease/phosphatase family metal-dependent hydrolase